MNNVQFRTLAPALLGMIRVSTNASGAGQPCSNGICGNPLHRRSHPPWAAGGCGCLYN